MLSIWTSLKFCRLVKSLCSCRINELQSSLSEQTRKREENMHTVDMVLREKDHAAQAERLQINAKVTDTMEDVNKKLLTKEMKIREDIQAKYLQLEKVGLFMGSTALYQTQGLIHTYT